MTKVAILPISTERGVFAYQGVAGDKRSQGDTIGQALDALTQQFPEIDSSLLVVVQNQRPDRFFTAPQQARLSYLMDQWKSARAAGTILLPEEQAELELLTESELYASGQRAGAMADELRQ